MGLEDLNKLDEQFNQAEPAKGGGDFTPIPEDTKVKVVVGKQEGALVGQKQTPVCKVVFNVAAPEAYARKRIWHDLWLTEANLKYLKRDLITLGWLLPDGKVPKGKRISQLLQQGDASLVGLGAEVTVGVEAYTMADPETGEQVERKKNIIKFFNAPYAPAAPAAAAPPPPAAQPTPAAIPGDDIPF